MRKFVFAGNRFFVLEEMLKKRLLVIKIFVVKGSYLEHELNKRKIKHSLIASKKKLIEELRLLNYDIFISNGLPHILPISSLTKGNEKKFINIHPSYLPDLKGADPVPGAILFGRDSGATCHYMNDEIDSGDIIARTKIKYMPDFDSRLLYQLSFIAEKKVFNQAFQKKFSAFKQPRKKNNIYYSFKENDLLINFKEDYLTIFRKIKAFNTQNKGAYFLYQNEKIRVMDVSIIQIPFMNMIFSNLKENIVANLYEDRIIIKKNNIYLELRCLVGSIKGIAIGDNILSLTNTTL